MVTNLSARCASKGKKMPVACACGPTIARDHEDVYTWFHCKIVKYIDSSVKQLTADSSLTVCRQ